jgi:hypothetical protein
MERTPVDVVKKGHAPQKDSPEMLASISGE